MGFLGLCEGDPVLKTLREVFGQNIVRVPEERYRPLTVLAVRDGSSSFRGDLKPLVLGDPAIEFDPSLLASSRMANVSGKRTRSVDIDLGIKILEGFLGGLGVPSAGIGAKFSGATKVSYAFEDVYRIWADINSVGRLLKGRKIDRENPAAAIFFGEDHYKFLVLDSATTSSSFTISVDRAESSNFKLDVPAIQEIMGNIKADVGVSTATGLELTFKGAKQLAFAFSCVQFMLSEEGAIKSLLPDEGLIDTYKLRGVSRVHENIRYSPDRVLLSPETGLIEIEPY